MLSAGGQAQGLQEMVSERGILAGK